MKHISTVSKAQEADPLIQGIFDALLPLTIQIFVYIGMLMQIKAEPTR
ncbi:MAG: hypothetical protein AAB791_00925 [Patescibacteria group bacterium]